MLCLEAIQAQEIPWKKEKYIKYLVYVISQEENSASEKNSGSVA